MPRGSPYVEVRRGDQDIDSLENILSDMNRRIDLLLHSIEKVDGLICDKMVVATASQSIGFETITRPLIISRRSHHVVD